MKISKPISGFTLLELLVVIAIIGVIATIIIASLGSAKSKANDSKALAQLSSMRTQAELYRTTYGSYGPNSTNCDEAGTLFGSGVPESLDELVRGMPSGYVYQCYVDPDVWGIAIQGSENNMWCLYSTSEQIFSREDSPVDLPSFCNAAFYY